MRLRRPLTVGLGLTMLGGLASCAQWPSSSVPPRLGSAPPAACTVAYMCGFPGATDTGVPAARILRAVPGQVSSGPGWHYDAASRQVDVTSHGAVLRGLSIACNLNIIASNVTITGDRIVTGGAYAISLRHTTGVTVENSTIAGRNAAAGRVNIAIGDLYGDSTGTVIASDNISAFRTAVSVSTGLLTGNYIHDPGYLAGDHTNGVLANGGTRPLMIFRNTILNDRPQTDAISIDTSTGTVVSNKTIEDNLLAGGGYLIYGGDSLGHATANIIIENNRFARTFFPAGGQYGPVAYFDSGGTGNAWAGNAWAASGRPVPLPGGRPAVTRASQSRPR